MSKSTPIAVDVASPAPRTDVPKFARFVYVPGDRMYVGDLKGWYKNDGARDIWAVLAKYPKVSQWLGKHPLSVLYCDISDNTLLVTDIYASGSWVNSPLILDSYVRELPFAQYANAQVQEEVVAA